MESRTQYSPWTLRVIHSNGSLHGGHRIFHHSQSAAKEHLQLLLFLAERLSPWKTNNGVVADQTCSEARHEQVIPLQNFRLSEELQGSRPIERYDWFPRVCSIASTYIYFSHQEPSHMISIRSQDIYSIPEGTFHKRIEPTISNNGGKNAIESVANDI